MVGLVPGSSDGFVDYSDIFHTLNMIAATLSIIGSGVVIFAFLAFPQLRRFFSRLVLYLAISDLWLCTSMLLGYSRPPHYMKCMVQSSFGTFFGLSSVMWTLCIADAMRRVLLARDLSSESKHEVRMHAVAWGLPLVAVIIVVATGVSGPAGTSCWIRNTTAGTIVRMITFYIPLWFGFAYTLWVYWGVSSMMEQLLDQHQVDGRDEYESSAFQYSKDIERQRRSLRFLLVLPLVLIICWGPSTLRRLLDIVFPGFAWPPLDYLCVIAGPSQGFLNAIIYGATPAVRDALFGRLDHSSQKMKGIQNRLRSLRKRGRNKPGAFQKLDEEVGLASGTAKPSGSGGGGGGPSAASGSGPRRAALDDDDDDSPGAGLQPEVVGHPSERAASSSRSPRGARTRTPPPVARVGSSSPRDGEARSNRDLPPAKVSPRGVRGVSDDPLDDVALGGRVAAPLPAPPSSGEKVVQHDLLGQDDLSALPRSHGTTAHRRGGRGVDGYGSEDSQEEVQVEVEGARHEYEVFVDDAHEKAFVSRDRAPSREQESPKSWARSRSASPPSPIERQHRGRSPGDQRQRGDDGQYSGQDDGG